MRKNLEEIVYDSLKSDERCRSSNEMLYLAVCKRINLDAVAKPFYIVMNQLEKLELPTFVQVIKAKQKIMTDEPKLRPADLYIGTRYEQRIMTQENDTWRGEC